MATFWEKLQFWKKKPMRYNENEHFNYVQISNGEEEKTAIVLLIPGYEDVVYLYHQARVVEEMGGLAKLEFGYTILNPGKHDIDDLQKSEEFSTIMGDLLTQIIIDKETYEARNNNTEEPDYF